MARHLMAPLVGAIFSMASHPATAGLSIEKMADTTVIKQSSCSYGRGKLAIADAQARAATALHEFVHGRIQLDLSATEQQLLDNSFTEVSRNALVQGLEQGTLAVRYGSPYLQGDDTCVDASLALDASGSGANADDGIQWDNDTGQAVEVTVIGEGWPDARHNMTARQVAELDACKRAIQQVVGVMLKSGYMQQSYTAMGVDNDTENVQMREIAMQSVSTETRGHVSQWTELGNKSLQDGGISLTLQVTVNKEAVSHSLDELTHQIGSPTVFAEASNQELRKRLATTLSSMGFNLSNDIEQASLILKADSRLIDASDGARLKMDIALIDPYGNRYGEWRNTPSLIALPNSARVEDELLEIHLATRTAQQDIRNAILDAAREIAHRGGPVREVMIPQTHLPDKANLGALLGSITGVSDVSIKKEGNTYHALLRYPDSAQRLSQYLQPTLAIQPGMREFDVKILTEYKLAVN